jgi:hypothetical protein
MSVLVTSLDKCGGGVRDARVAEGADFAVQRPATPGTADGRHPPVRRHESRTRALAAPISWAVCPRSRACLAAEGVLLDSVEELAARSSSSIRIGRVPRPPQSGSVGVHERRDVQRRRVDFALNTPYDQFVARVGAQCGGPLLQSRLTAPSSTSPRATSTCRTSSALLISRTGNLIRPGGEPPSVVCWNDGHEAVYVHDHVTTPTSCSRSSGATSGGGVRRSGVLGGS